MKNHKRVGTLQYIFYKMISEDGILVEMKAFLQLSSAITAKFLLFLLFRVEDGVEIM